MAKVEGPLFSLEARGKIGNVMVHFPWKGRNVVRKWLKPTNPRDVDQKIIRQKLAVFGKNLVQITTPSTAAPNGSILVQGIKRLTPAAQIWNAYFTKKGMEYVANDSDFTNLLSLGYACTSVDSQIWKCCGLELELDTILSTADAYATDIEPGLMLYMAAYAAYAMGLTDATNSYSVHPCNWNTAEISQFATDFTSLT